VQLVRTMEGHTDWVYAIALSVDDACLYSGGRDRIIRKWSTATGEVCACLGESRMLCSVSYASRIRRWACSRVTQTM
jgi:WD40 repeat protein